MRRPDRSPINLALPTVVTAVLVGSVLGVAFQADPEPVTVAAPVPTAQGLVVDETGRPVPKAVVTVGGAKVLADTRGHYSVALRAPALASASATGHLSRAFAVEPGKARNVVLTSNAKQTLSLRFGGDTMMGRRFYEGYRGQAPALPENATPEDHAAVLRDIGPFLQDSDLTVVNLETALLADTAIEVEGKRRPGLHPTKDLIVTSATALAKGLALAGVDVVSLGNNHTIDGLKPGLQSTNEALDAAGIAHFGAGVDADAAWKPALVKRRGQTVAFLGCTTVTGRQTSIPYVASASSPGAAECEATRLADEVKKAAKRADSVVVMIHGGVEYRRSQTVQVRSLATVAQQAGARVVIGSHPHVIGGLVSTQSNVFAESLGNLVFDQELWPTFPSMLVRVDLRRGVPVSTTVDPIVIDAYRPRPAIGEMADAIARIAAGHAAGVSTGASDGAGRLGGTSAALALGPAPAAKVVKVPLKLGQVRRLASGWWYAPPATPGQPLVRMGSDLLFGTGTFEPMEIGRRAANVPLWSLGKYGSVTTDAACGPASADGSAGSGLMLARTPLSTRTAFASPQHRTPVTPRQKLSVLASLRQASEGSQLQVHWFKAFAGPSSSISSIELPEGSWDRDSCRRVRFDVTVPKGAVAAQVFVLLKPPAGGQRVRRLAVDDVSLVDWAPSGRTGRRYGVLEVLKDASVPFSADDGGLASASPIVPVSQP
ncbi:hypothetical protein N865_17465 [Intrasporangium oryzae NRRL B-24470]|uniref:Capsule synthesis protein CapA domain-containing protein n=1 Tax=Intrasporangium oryzae NRRL B-24470 TaxID=1386089 RepID=W9GI42_9MICO|nr:CapA family protein [Intrasporangium oryzae]EWT03524.1 hypothetical protein N865_17465 [Intrasporangium oryzae NRRL B-24470]